jgi:peptidoglycan/xylan/chitin deacetylase (PgdA/CDA1 family)/glycosyltransferase involved in cell wall biosynthesis
VAAPDLSAAPRFTVIVPTRGRRDLVVRLVELLREQELRDFEVVVVVDGADENTVNALRALELPFPLTVREQAHGGAAAARNAGAAVARGEILLFLDDDMAPDAALLAQHDRSYRAGAQMVLGHLPLDPASPKTATAASIGGWAERRRARLAASGDAVPVTELISGQMSLYRDAFEQLGGFDLAFTRGGLVPGADRDFGYRARRSGLKIVFNPDAISHQFYAVDAEDFTRRTRNGARGDRILAARYPEIAGELWQPRFDTLIAKLTLEPLVRLPRALSRPLRSLAVRRFSRAQPDRLSRRLFFAVQTMERRRGARDEARALRIPIAAVLAYHSISDLSADTRLAPYGIPPDVFARQLDDLLVDGWAFVDLEHFLDAVRGGTPLPPRSLLVTFDDAYADLVSAAVPILEERGIPAVVFAVGDHIAGANVWRRQGARELPLLGSDGLREAAERGVVVGSHGATHRPLVDVPADELDSELAGSADRIESTGVDRPDVLSYPHGEWSPAVAAAVARAGYRAAFTVAPGAVRRLHDPFTLPRIEVLAGESGRALARRLARLGQWGRR